MIQRAQSKRILLATDFSPRSDRAARRALLIARQLQARVTIVHVVDDEQPSRLIEAARAEAERLLEGMRESFDTVDYVACDTYVATGEAFAGTLAKADDISADLIVIGPHRRRILKDVFTGTTAERIMREGRRPVLMVNGPPTNRYRNALLTTDMSPASLEACRAFDELALIQEGSNILIHVFDAPATRLMRRASLSQADMNDYVADEKNRVEVELRTILQRQDFKPDRLVMRLDKSSVAAEILDAAKEQDADLIVVGSRGQSLPAKLLLGSTTEALMRMSDRDVLAVPGPER